MRNGLTHFGILDQAAVGGIVEPTLEVMLQGVQRMPIDGHLHLLALLLHIDDPGAQSATLYDATIAHDGSTAFLALFGLCVGSPGLEEVALVAAPAELLALDQIVTFALNQTLECLHAQTAQQQTTMELHSLAMILNVTLPLSLLQHLGHFLLATPLLEHLHAQTLGLLILLALWQLILIET